MSVEIVWINHASFRLASEGCVVYIDPWKLPGEPHDADVVFVSHSHFDHCSPPDVARVSKDDTTVIAPGETVTELPAATAITPGKCITIGDVTIEPVAAYNIGKKFHPKDNGGCGAVITMGGKRIYYAGDTDLIDEMSGLGEPNAALLPVGGTYTLTAAEAAKACEVIGCKIAIPYHWGDIVGQASDAKTFAQQAPCAVTILQPGEKTTL